MKGTPLLVRQRGRQGAWSLRLRGIRAVTFALAVGALQSGCAGGRVYPNGINHMYLCAAGVVRGFGYQVREQDFNINSGKLVAARSAPDPKETVIHRGFFRRSWEVIWNLWEHGKFETWDEDLAQKRIRTEERVVLKFRRGSGWLRWLGWSSKKKTTLKLKADVTDYGREDWVIRRERREKALHERLHEAIGDCLGSPSPSKHVKQAAPAVAAAPKPEQPTPPTEVLEPDAEPKKPGEKAEPAAAPSPAPGPVVDPAQALASAKKSYEGADYQAAVSRLNQVLAVEPQNVEALGYLGAAYYQLNELDRSILAYERYAKLAPSEYRMQEFLAELKRERAAGKPAP